LVKLVPDDKQFGQLKQVMERFNKACNYIAGVAFKKRLANKIALHHILYYRIRKRFGLSAQMTVRAVSKVVETYKRDKSVKPIFKDHSAMVYDDRILSWKGLDYASLLTLKGRIKVPIIIGEYQKGRMDRIRGQADLLLRNGAFYLSATIDTPEPVPFEAKDWIGVDLGIKNIATDSDGVLYSGSQLNSLRHRNARLRAKLQKKDTKSAKRLLKKRSGKEARFARNINHTISKGLVAKAKDTERGIVLEDLMGIRDRITVRKTQRRTQHSWAFNQLRRFVEYKAKLAGVPLKFVDPMNTSRTCPNCGTIDKNNRNGEEFICVVCGFAGHADHIAAENIRRAVVGQPYAGDHLIHLQTHDFVHG